MLTTNQQTKKNENKMKQKIEKNETTTKPLTLTEAIKGMHVSDWEIRIHSNGSRKVYARYIPKVQSM